MLEIHQIVSSYHGSNTYIIPLDTGSVVLIDPGDPDISIIENWLKTNNKSISAVFLTHEHADHCAGVNNLYKISPFSLFCSPECDKNMRNSKQNFSFYIDIIDAFKVEVPSITLGDGQIIAIESNPNGTSNKSIKFSFYHTPGHSPGGSCIVLQNNIFTGDTILNKLRTPLTFPHSQRKAYYNSLQKLIPVLKPGMTIYPGHGDPFAFEDFDTLLNQIKVSQSSRIS